MKICQIFVLILVLTLHLSAQKKRELRGAWIATIKNIDWPSQPGLTTEQQKEELKEIINSLHQNGINAVFFQIRSGCDAVYDSKIEPWSYWMTGKQGKAPDPFYDPLNYAIKLAHQKGMEMHAWLNPFRAAADTGLYGQDSTHISVIHPEWIIQKGKYIFLNPGIKKVRNYVKNIVTDIIKRYDIDGIHFDDYFYPYTGMTDEDINSFNKDHRGFQNIEDWRRDNVNQFVSDIAKVIKDKKPFLKFGISPFGIWKDGIPEGIKGFSAYQQIYCDAVHWLKEKLVDYIAPQIYWIIGGEQDYKLLADWWTDQAKDIHVYTGHALYKLIEKDWSSQSITDQIKYNQQSKEIKGSIFFRTNDILNDVKGIADSLKYHYYKYPALLPTMNWIDSIPPPLFPFNLRALSSMKGTFLIWDNPKFDEEQNKINYNVVYRSPADSILDIKNPEHVLAVVPADQSCYTDTSGEAGTIYRYIVTGLDRLKNESLASNPAGQIFSRLEICKEQPNQNELFHSDSLIQQNQLKIKFAITETEVVNLSLFFQNGDKIQNMLNEELKKGVYNISLNSANLIPGKYYYKLTTSSFSDMKSFLKIPNR